MQGSNKAWTEEKGLCRDAGANLELEQLVLSVATSKYREVNLSLTHMITELAAH